MPKVTEAHRQARRSEIAAAAIRCFARTGFQATSMADIIAESGLSAGAIYGHYKNKEELIGLAISEVLNPRFLEVAEARRRSPMPAPGDVIGQLVSGLRSQIGELQLLVQVWGQVALNPDLRTVTDGIGARVRGVFVDYLTDWYESSLAVPHDEAARLAERFAGLYVGIVQGYITQSTLFSDFDAEAYLAAASSIRPV
jgi:AcrR family transcriptional regulator